MPKLIFSGLLLLIISAMAMLTVGGAFETKPGAADALDPFVVSIDVGRVDVMVDNGRAALGLLTQDYVDEMGGGPLDETPRSLFLTLHKTLANYTDLQLQACAEADFLPRDQCQGAYVPSWLSLARDYTPSLEEIGRWNEALQTEVSALTGVLCDQARAVSGDQFLCAIE